MRLRCPCSGALSLKPTRQQFAAACQSQTDLSLECIEAIVISYDSHVAAAAAAAAAAAKPAGGDGADAQLPPDLSKVLSIGNVVGFDWKLGITVRSSASEVPVEVPFVTVILRVADCDGRVSSHTLELSIADFRVRVALCALGHSRDALAVSLALLCCT